MNAVIIIPARLESTRLSRKLLRDLCGKPVIQRTYEQATKARFASRVLIATDAAEIARAAKSFGAEVVMTRSEHQSGTERIAEAARSIDAGLIVNIQGDEPEIDPAHIDALIETHALAKRFAATLACPFPADLDPENPAAVKAILGEAIAGLDRVYEARDFTRAVPEGRHAPHLHVGAYAFGRDALLRFASAPPGTRERLERLEQLRILEMGESIAVKIVDRATRGIDTQSDYEASVARFARAVG